MSAARPDVTIATVVRDYEALWAQPDERRRAKLIAACLVDNAEIEGPGYVLRGVRAISDEAARFMRAEPGARALMASGIDAHGRWARFAVKVVDAAGAVRAEGLDVVEFAADGRIARVITFWGALPSIERPVAAKTSRADAGARGAAMMRRAQR